ncbi:MAG TPA: PIN domain-containing protein [Polyangia bacterium]|nr:PIN domain-containing protein [Polyangia bacterium]
MGALIDTSIFVAAERGQFDLEAELAKRSGDWFGLATISAAELLEGVYLADTTNRRENRRTIVERIISTLPVVPFDVAIAREYARLRALLRKAGASVGVHDLQIAATALALGQAVATRDEKSFPRIPGLEVEVW